MYAKRQGEPGSAKAQPSDSGRIPLQSSPDSPCRGVGAHGACQAARRTAAIRAGSATLADGHCQPPDHATGARSY
eukprot:CAMPEP_0170320112 /NCGR_PEP_ID=MMETSP0116_2-20130129/60779_1 /TAXON_ID=400756 /ORGANISM="Durinskia baltica, Strain CSIRO CS-38" /LENGTH=74 /DNA_ID=CAMNT_0010572861 /DNA_START=39 /DNA_END=263 /DNA_ORIENTATION=-